MDEDYFDEEMNEDFGDTERERLIERFEKMMDNDTVYYFDSDDYAIVFDHYFYTGKINKAQKVLLQALKQFPDSQDLKLKKVHYLLSLGKEVEARKLMAEIDDNDGFKDADTLLEQAYLYTQLRSFDKSLQKYRQLLKIVEQDKEYMEDVYLGMSDVYEQMGDTKQSLYYLQQALEIDPDNKFLFSNVFDAFYQLPSEEDKYQIVDYFINFTNKHPLSSVAWSYLGLAYAEFDLFEKAIEAFDNSLAIDNKNEDALSYQMSAFISLNEREKANEVFKDLLQLSQFKELTWYLLATSLVAIKDYESAVYAFQKSIDENPLFSLAFASLAALYSETGQIDKAIENIKKAIDIDNESFEYWLSLGEYLCDAERDDEAKIVYEYLADHFPENEETWLDYSDFYVLQDEIDVAIGVLYEGLEKQPDNISYIYRMANYLFLKGDVVQATSYLQMAYMTNPDILNEFFEYDESMYDIPEVIDFVANINKNIE